MASGEQKAKSRTFHLHEQRRNYTSICMQNRGPEMQISCDENGIPTSAKCSACGAMMPQSSRSIANPIDNVAWFRDQFSQHVAASHPN